MQITQETRDGRQQLHFKADDGKHALYVGSFRGVIAGVPVTNDVVELDSEKAAHELSHHIGLWYEDNGHPSHTDPDEPYVHLCTAKCGKLKRSDSEPYQALALTRLELQNKGIVSPSHQWGHGKDLGLSVSDEPPVDMARASAAAENAALNGLDGTGSTNVIPDASLHTADPGTTGASENANSGSYARQACSWNAASGGNKTNSSSLTFSTLGTIAVAYFGTWSSATYGAGNYAIGGALTSSVTAATITIAAGAITLSAS